jgi:hypothetical protein
VVDWARRDETKRAEIKSVAAMPENANFLEVVAQRAPHCGMALTPEYRSRLRVYGVFTKGAAAGMAFYPALRSRKAVLAVAGRTYVCENGIDCGLLR